MTSVVNVTGRSASNADTTSEIGRFFSDLPYATPKFAVNAGPRRSEFISTMARFVIELPPARRNALLNSLPADVKGAAGTLIADGSVEGVGYYDFLLTAITDPKQEREQAVDTLSDNTVIFYSGQSAPVLSGTGVFMNTFQDDQNVWFQLLYAELLRGSALARRGLIARLRYDSFFMSGYMTSLVTSLQGGIKNAVDFSFTFRVKRIEIATPILYYPSPAVSRFDSALFRPEQPAGGDNDTRRGVQTSAEPLAPTATPAAAQDDAEADARAAARRRRRRATARAAQAEADAQIATEAAAVPQNATTNMSVDPVGASGDVRQNMSVDDSRMYLTYSRGVSLTSSNSAQQLDSIMSTGSQRGTAIVSPVTGGEEYSSAYASNISSQNATSNTAGRTPPRASSSASSQLDDVYRVYGTTLARAREAQGSLSTVANATSNVPPRTRGRPSR